MPKEAADFSIHPVFPVFPVFHIVRYSYDFFFFFNLEKSMPPSATSVISVVLHKKETIKRQRT